MRGPVAQQQPPPKGQVAGSNPAAMKYEIITGCCAEVRRRPRRFSRQTRLKKAKSRTEPVHDYRGMAERESSLISECVSAGMKATAVRGKHLSRPPLAPALVSEIADYRSQHPRIHKKIGKKANRSRVGEIATDTIG